MGLFFLFFLTLRQKAVYLNQSVFYFFLESMKFSDPVKYVEFLNDLMLQKNASDMYLTYGEPPVLRILEEVHRETDLEPLDDELLNQLALTLMNTTGLDFFEKHGSIDLGIGYQDRRYRVNISRQRGHIMIVARLLRKKVPTLESLCLPGIFKELSHRTNGIIFLAGATGSGKSTTLAAMVEEINQTEKKHILTIEDPIEFTHKSKRSLVAQREVHYDTYSFSRALKSALREDPDVVLLGEMRDLETISAAITIAETGHLVFATLHTNSAAQSVDRMIDVFPAEQQPQIRSQLAGILMAVCSQRLVPAIGGGRVVAAEIMIANSAVRSIIREGKTHQLDNTIQTGANEGMQTMDRTLAKLVQQGTVTYDSARDYAVDTHEFDRLVKGI